jgi:regulatory protein
VPRAQPKKISPKYLENAALFHLSRFAASREQLRRALLRKVQRSVRVHGGDAESFAGAIDELLERLTRAGLLDDQRLAQSKADSLRASGHSARAIQFKLLQKGLGEELVEQQVSRVGAEVTDEEAAMALAKRRRLGPFRRRHAEANSDTDGDDDAATLRKELAVMARAGFSYGVAMRVLASK